MNPEEFRKHGHKLVEWIAEYMENIDKYPVKSSVEPGTVFSQLPTAAPERPESFESVFADFEKIIMPGITHWQSPSFFAYFPANTSPPSILAEMLTSALGAQCMIWETSPAAAELEEMVMNWLRDMTGLPAEFEGVIQDTASTATLSAILTARERLSDYKTNEEGAQSTGVFRVYCSDQTHSSIEKAVKIAGIGKANLVKIGVDENLAINPTLLKEAIEADLLKGYLPCCVVASIGTTGTTAIDNIKLLGEVCSRHDIWLHVDAALAGTALILPEMRWMTDGIEQVDSFVFNPHKWMFTNFDCTAYFVRDAGALIRTFEILPEYLKTRTRGKVNDYRDWGIPLGRRFRALKLWAVIRCYGVEGLQTMIREHIALASWLAAEIDKNPSFELFTHPKLNTVVFRFNPGGVTTTGLNELNESLNHRLNDSGLIYLTHTVIGGERWLRMVTSQTNVTMDHVSKAWTLIQEYAQ